MTWEGYPRPKFRRHQNHGARGSLNRQTGALSHNLKSHSRLLLEIGRHLFAGGFDVGQEIQNFLLGELIQQPFGHGRYF